MQVWAEVASHHHHHHQLILSRRAQSNSYKLCPLKVLSVVTTLHTPGLWIVDTLDRGVISDQDYWISPDMTKWGLIAIAEGAVQPKSCVSIWSSDGNKWLCTCGVSNHQFRGYYRNLVLGWWRWKVKKGLFAWMMLLCCDLCWRREIWLRVTWVKWRIWVLHFSDSVTCNAENSAENHLKMGQRIRVLTGLPAASLSLATWQSRPTNAIIETSWSATKIFWQK